MAFSFIERTLTASSSIDFDYNQPNILITVQAFLQSPTRSSIRNNISIYDENGVLHSNFTLQTSSTLFLKNVRISRLVFDETLDIDYVIHIFISVNTYTNMKVLREKERQAEVFIIPILFGQVGVV